MPCFNSIAISAPIEEVWKRFSDFHQLEWGRPFINAVEKVGTVPGDEVGAKRVLNGAFHETLIEYESARYRIAYTIDDGPEPISRDSVKNYVGAVKLLPVTADDTTFVQWTSTYEAEDSDLVANFCNPIYAALLEALRDSFAR